MAPHQKLCSYDPSSRKNRLSSLSVMARIVPALLGLVMETIHRQSSHNSTPQSRASQKRAKRKRINKRTQAASPPLDTHCQPNGCDPTLYGWNVVALVHGALREVRRVAGLPMKSRKRHSCAHTIERKDACRQGRQIDALRNRNL